MPYPPVQQGYSLKKILRVTYHWLLMRHLSRLKKIIGKKLLGAVEEVLMPALYSNDFSILLTFTSDNN
jgi:hypothetical protein